MWYLNRAPQQPIAAIQSQAINFFSLLVSSWWKNRGVVKDIKKNSDSVAVCGSSITVFRQYSEKEALHGKVTSQSWFKDNNENA